MDIVVRLADGSITTVEIQKISAAFPAERMSCYSADLLLRQYEQVGNRLKDNFNYSALKKVFTIVIFENTDPKTTEATVYQAFHAEKIGKQYLHHGTTVFDTGLELDFLQEFYLISLDVFREVGYAKDNNELTAWLSLLATSTYEDAELLCQKYPWMEEIFVEISEYVHNPEGVVGMFSEALKIMDDNMYHYMADQYQAKVERQQAEIENQQAEIENQQAEIENLHMESQKLYQMLIEQLKKNDSTKELAILEIAAICESEEVAKDLVEKYW